MKAMKQLVICSLLALPLGSVAAESLSKSELELLVKNQTANCVKTKDKSQCYTYFAGNGEVKRFMTESQKRKAGRWFLDDSDRLCILWDGKYKPLCFVVLEKEDGSYDFTKKGKVKSSVTTFDEGNPHKL